MSKSLRETIKELVKCHLDDGYMAMGQCLTAVGWVGGTLPEMYEDQGMVELPMADVAGGGIAVGAGLAGKRPMYIIRYQGFNWFNAPIVINYAAKSKDIWKRPCPMLIRSIAMEGAIGPVAGSSHASLYYRMPGLKIASPMTPLEYINVYKEFMNGDEVIYVSEHRGAYPNDKELKPVVWDDPDIVLIAISITRFSAIRASEKLLKMGLKVAVHHLMWLKPLMLDHELITSVLHSKKGFLVLDDDYEDGMAKSIAFDISKTTSVIGQVMGLKNKTAGFAQHLDNLPPNEDEIYDKVIEIIKG